MVTASLRIPQGRAVHVVRAGLRNTSLCRPGRVGRSRA